MKKAKLIFKDNTPFSLDFDDFYFNFKDGLNESKFVYTHSFEWKNQENFIIAESGFGIGLNFFLTLKRFLETTPSKRPKKLFYISCRRKNKISIWKNKTSIKVEILFFYKP